MKIYWAAPLFNETERAYNKDGAKYLEGLGHEVFLPQRDVELKPRGPESRRRVREADLIGLMDCDIVIATLEGEAFDPGTVYEIGYAEGMGKPAYVICGDDRWLEDNINAMLSTAHWYSNLSELVRKALTPAL